MHSYIVKAKQRVATNTLLLTLRPKRHRDRLVFSPGQYAAIGFKRDGRPSPVRCFSIVSSPNKPDELQFAMRIYGDFTSSVAQLNGGDTVFVYGPFGDFVVDEEYDKSVVLIAGGIGVTPFMSMIRYATEIKSTLPITLLLSSRSANNIPFRDEIRELERQNPRFKAVFFITDGKTTELRSSRIISRRIDEQYLNELTNGKYNRFTYFICGPQNFNETMQTILSENNTDPSRVVTEEFTPSSQINSLSLLPKYSPTKWTYAFSSFAMIFAVGFIMTIDLSRAVPKLSAAAAPPQATVQQVTTPSTSTITPVQPESSTDTTTTDSQPATQSQTSTDPSSTSSTLPSQPTQQQTYQAPMTSVS